MTDDVEATSQTEHDRAELGLRVGARDVEEYVTVESLGTEVEPRHLEAVMTASRAVDMQALAQLGFAHVLQPGDGGESECQRPR